MNFDDFLTIVGDEPVFNTGLLLAGNTDPAYLRRQLSGWVNSGKLWLLHELDLSPHEDEVLSIKIEVDTRPPVGAVMDTTIVRRYEILRLQHHDRASLLAGKLHAILQRPYTKGRDIYDLFWYLSSPEWPSPNLAMLNTALAQTGWSGSVLTPENWQGHTLRALARIDWRRAVDDVRPFLMDPRSANLLTQENFNRLLDS